MSSPRLGVPFMDRDHAALDLLFDQVAASPDAELAALLDKIAQELHDHFEREEVAMTEARVPVLLSHLELHAQILREIENMRREVETCDANSARQLIGTLLRQLVAEHVATADTVSAHFLSGAVERLSARKPRLVKTGAADD